MLRDQVKQAQATGDIGTLLRLMAQTASITPADYIKKTLGTIMFLYYQYARYFRLRPVDLEDMVDGLLYISTSNFLEKRELEEWKAKQQRQQ